MPQLHVAACDGGRPAHRNAFPPPARPKHVRATLYLTHTLLHLLGTSTGGSPSPRCPTSGVPLPTAPRLPPPYLNTRPPCLVPHTRAPRRGLPCATRAPATAAPRPSIWCSWRAGSCWAASWAWTRRGGRRPSPFLQVRAPPGAGSGWAHCSKGCYHHSTNREVSRTWGAQVAVQRAASTCNVPPTRPWEPHRTNTRLLPCLPSCISNQCP